MCGIAGLIAKKSIDQKKYNAFVTSSDLMSHRGPDYKGVCQSDNVLLIHHRLSILDLDKRAHQPFASATGQYRAVYNGEIYNFRELTCKYKIEPKTSSDTEIMLESFVLKGEQAIKEWNGIFALAIFDEQTKQLHLMRDRFGVKPLYIYQDDEVILFASEAKVILNWLPSFSIASEALSQYLWYGNTTGELTIVEGLRKIVPGTQLVIDTHTGKILKEKRYWDINSIIQQDISEPEAIEQTKILLEAAVKRQLISDVPVGVLLSGGIDSSSIVAFASKHYEKTLDTYSVDYDYNIGGKSELKKAAMVAKRFGTNHHELRVESGDVVDVFSRLVFQYDEPFADAANIPLYQLAKACSKNKRVILQGDGGDEFFAGYRRYNVLNSYWFWRIASFGYPLIPEKRWRERIKRLRFVLGQSDRAKQMAYYLTEEVPYKSPYQVLNPEYQSNVDDEIWYSDYLQAAEMFKNLNRVQQLLYTDTHILLPNRYLEKVDKATMLCSLEARVPFLDNELSEFALSLPAKLKVRKGQKKYLLKKALENIVPREILYGPKRGFDVPFRTWLRSDLYSFAKDSFRENTSGILDFKGLEKILDIHRGAKADYAALLWKSLVLTYWLSIYKGKIKN
ncbi:MAG: asparagine synthase (glutamine-hydrolyzing) [Cyclobacteriaceae bacterium]|nr:asparagine synthase (glutamine-hydrolyzing) [Cyclobacteriaceae bacterium]